MRFALTLAAALVALFAVAPAAAQMACTGGSCGEAGCLCSALSNSGEACGYHGSMGADCSGCHNCPGSGWIMGTGNTINGRSGTCTATCSSADSEWTACGHPPPPAGSVTKTACSSGTPQAPSGCNSKSVWSPEDGRCVNVCTHAAVRALIRDTLAANSDAFNEAAFYFNHSSAHGCRYLWGPSYFATRDL